MYYKNSYTVYDVIEAEHNLEPLVCVYCGSKETTYHDYAADAYCSTCGRWQSEEAA